MTIPNQTNLQLAEEISKNRLLRERNRIAFEKNERYRHSPVFRWAKWATEPLSDFVYWFRILVQKRKRKPQIEEYLKNDSFKGLHVGCGPFRNPGWQNTDFINRRGFFRGLTDNERAMDFHVDITEELPYSDSCLDAIFAEEVIEHVDMRQGEHFIREAVRVLKPGGVLRLTTPDARGLCQVFAGDVKNVSVDDFEPFWLNPYWSQDRWLNGVFRFYGHQHIWSYEGLEQSLLSAGFARVERVKVHETVSDLVELRGLERHGTSNAEIIRINNEVRIIAEAFR